MKYTIGIDFGTLSGRAVLIEVESGKSIAGAQMDYPHGVMDREFLDGRRLKGDSALQDPQDYLAVLETVLADVLKEGRKKAGIDPEDVIGIGIDVTSATVLPVLADGRPLTALKEFAAEPQAYVKLWKHHGAQKQADRINQVAAERKEAFLDRYGRKISPEWVLPKMMEVLEEAPEVYERADYFMDMTDYLVWYLTGAFSRGRCAAGYKALWAVPEKEGESGYPSEEFFAALDPRLKEAASTKLAGKLLAVGEAAGTLRPELACGLGLSEKTVVASGYVDAHAAVPALGVSEEETMVSILGTSACHMLLDTKEKIVPGTCGYVRDGIMPGYFGYEAGQPSFGDTFSWWIENALPASVSDAARAEGVSVHTWLARKAEKLAVGESGLLALDWWNGNRSILVDSGLSGMLLGLTLQTRPEEIYRALIESVCFGTRMIVENFRAHGLKVSRMIATGGIALKNPLLMQIMADVLQLSVQAAETDQSGALGSAIAAACAAGKERGGYDSMKEAAKQMGSPILRSYEPDPAKGEVYNALYAHYQKLYDLFGRELGIMQDLKRIASDH